MNETLLMSIGAGVFGLTIWAVLLAAYSSGREADSKSSSPQIVPNSGSSPE
jgi:hypothetical protein